MSLYLAKKADALAVLARLIWQLQSGCQLPHFCLCTETSVVLH
jgi:hypothetical protein